jgi:uncharacterized protein (TIGR03437 family)
MQISPPARAVIAQDAMAQSRPLVNRGKPEPANNALFFPVQAVFAAGEIYVADSFNNRVIVFPDLSTGPAVTSTGPYLARRVLGQVGFDLQAINLLEGRELWEPNGIAIDALSDPPRLYVADTLNNRILGFRDARKLRPGDKADIVIGQPDFLRSIGNYPSGDTDQPTDSNLLIPQDVTVDSEGNLWVADTGNGRVLRFPKPFEQSQQRANLVIGQSGFTTKITDASARTMGRPSGLAFTGEGHLVVADRGHHRVLFFLKPLSTGMAATKVLGQADYGSSVVGNAVNRLNTPRHIAIDSDDRLYVADSGNNRIMVWDRVTIAAETNSLSAVQIENGLASNQRLRTPVGVAVNQRTGEIWVTDFSVTPNRLLRYPSYFNLVANPNVTADAAIPIIGPLSAAFDGFGNLFVSDLLHRVGMYFHGSRTLNSAHYGRGRVGDFSGQALAPGMVASIFSLGTDLASEVKVFNELPEPIPLPTELADTQVLVNDRPAPLYFVSRRQVNFQVPSNIPDSGDLEIQVVRPSLGQVLAAGCTTVQTAGAATADPNDDRYQCTGPVQATVASPALFTADATGTGHLAALNQDSTVNSVSNPASRGQVIQLFGTGQGRVPNAPPDGTPATGLLHTEETPTVIIGSSAVDPGDVQYSGLAPNLVGVWQINVRIPDRVAPANQVDVVVVYRSRVSNLQNPTGIRTTIAVR